MTLLHIPVMLNEILEALPEVSKGTYLDVTAGGGGHLSEVLLKKSDWIGEAWDRDPEAKTRVMEKLRTKGVDEKRVHFVYKDFAQAPENKDAHFDYILADLGVSSFQLDDMKRGMSFQSEEALDFRMDIESGVSFRNWLGEISEMKLAECFYRYAEEPRAKALAKAMLSWDDSSFVNAKALASRIASFYNYRDPSRKHPATRVFQALRIAVNDELGQLESLLEWAPDHLKVGGRLAIISFHSLEDRIVKQKFKKLAATASFSELSKKPLAPSDDESRNNSRSRSAKLRILQRN
ncbi:16S rRNA (cytosine(1402)-N(4))-methyltransferase RsmH [bacterium]|nr:16S rRNA (cytosine(1402)-N(4))-methyltransferase RsmH [bacterium]